MCSFTKILSDISTHPLTLISCCDRISLTPFHTIPILTTLEKEVFENIVGKRENFGNHRFLLFTQSPLAFAKQSSIF